MKKSEALIISSMKKKEIKTRETSFVKERRKFRKRKKWKKKQSSIFASVFATSTAVTRSDTFFLFKSRESLFQRNILKVLIRESLFLPIILRSFHRKIYRRKIQKFRSRAERRKFLPLK